MPDEGSWAWHGLAGHFIAADRCCFHLHTTVGHYRVSTVGCYHPYGDETGIPKEIGCGRLYETMVFRIGPEGVVWTEIDGTGYNEGSAAELGHMGFCAKWAREPFAPQTVEQQEAKSA